jgi:uncharacterized RDD family membrane protein YckC
MFCSHCGHPVADSSNFCGSCGALTRQQSVATAPAGAPRYLDPETGRPLAPWWKRLLAYLLDGAIIAVPCGIVWQFVTLSTFSSLSIPTACNQQSPTQQCSSEFIHDFLGRFVPAFGLLVLLQLVLGGLYFAGMVGSRRGQTVGMMALGVAVRDSVNDTSIGIARAFVRWLVLVALSLPLGIPAAIDCLAPLWDRRRQAWHDHAAGCVLTELR